MAVDDGGEDPRAREIWNPWAALFLSIVFTPVFGAMLHKTDLRRIGDKDGAFTALVWERSSMLLLAVAAVLQPIAAVREGWGLALFTVDLFLLLGWWAGCGFRHARLISEAVRISPALEPVGVSRAVTMGLFGLLAWIALFHIARIAWTMAGII